MRLTVNGAVRDLDLDPDMPLLWALRDHLGLRGTKYGCGIGACGACTVHLAGAAVRSCQLPVGAIDVDEAIVTIEGLGTADALHPVQAAWLAEQAPQCGYCQSGQIMQAAALLADDPSPDDAAIAATMNGNLCRCGAYDAIRAAILRAARGGPVGAVEDVRAQLDPEPSGAPVPNDSILGEPVSRETILSEPVADPLPVQPFRTPDGFADLPETGPTPALRDGTTG